MRIRYMIHAIAGLAALLHPTDVAAVVICVSQAGPPCLPSIQAGIDRANAGDVVSIGRGVYYENVVVAAGKDGLQIVGQGKAATIVDPAPYADRGIVGTNIGFVVRSDGVQLRALSVRNGLVGVQVEGNRTTVERIRLNRADEGIVVGEGLRGTQVLSCEFHAGRHGVVSRAVDVTLAGNRFAGVVVGVLAGSDTGGVFITGNRFERGENGVAISSTGVRVQSNDVRHHRGFGLYVSGGNPIARDNRVQGANRGIAIQCLGACERALVAANVVTDARELGISVFTEGAGAVVQDNRVRRALIGMDLSGSEVRAEGNHVSSTGFVGTAGINDGRGDCFQIRTATSDLLRNMAAGCTDSGFLVLSGSPARLERNEARRTGENGFTIDGRFGGVHDTLLFANTAVGNAAQGIAIINGASSTTVTGNVATGNRTDFCDAGIGTMASGNTFGTVGPCTILH